MPKFNLHKIIGNIAFVYIINYLSSTLCYLFISHFPDKLSRLIDDQCFQRFMALSHTCANSTTEVIVACDNHFISRLLPADTIPAREERQWSLRASFFINHAFTRWSLRYRFSQRWPKAIDDIHLLATIRWCTERRTAAFLSCELFYIWSFCRK